jgi:hypothetical protein
MKKIPLEFKKEMEADPFYKICALAGYEHISGGKCSGPITWNHPLRYAGSQIVEPWATVPLCEFHHSVNLHQDNHVYKEELSVWIALDKAHFEGKFDYIDLTYYKATPSFAHIHRVLFNKYNAYSESHATKAYKAILAYRKDKMEEYPKSTLIKQPRSIQQHKNGVTMASVYLTKKFLNIPFNPETDSVLKAFESIPEEDRSKYKLESIVKASETESVAVLSCVI